VLLDEWLGDTEYTVESSSGLSWDRSPSDCVTYALDFGWLVHSGDEDDALFTGIAEFELSYGCAEDFTFDDEEAEAFGEASVLLSAYPFVRELVQSLTTRAGLPPLTLSTIRRPLTVEDGKE
jgi:hypothetical protein